MPNKLVLVSIRQNQLQLMEIANSVSTSSVTCEASVYFLAQVPKICAVCQYGLQWVVCMQIAPRVNLVQQYDIHAYVLHHVCYVTNL